MARKPTQPKIHPVVYVDPSILKGASYNPRKINDPEFKQLATNIAKFGFLENVVASKEDNEIIGGHQRVKAVMALIKGDIVPTEGGKPIKFALETIPVIYMEGLPLFQRKAINISLNRIGGEWDYDKLVGVIHDMYEESKSVMNDILNDTEAQVAAIEAMAATGFTPSELADFVDVKIEKPDGKGPLPTQGVPKLTLEFTTKDLRDKFKAYLGSICIEGECAGDAVAERLEI